MGQQRQSQRGASNGSGNSLTIANGGQVVNDNGYVGNAVAADNNSFLVTGAGSVWSNSAFLFIGNSGSANSMIISNGGHVFNTLGTIGNNATASNNWVLVTGSGSVWSNSSSLPVGSLGSGNSLTIADGGQVFNGIGYIGLNAGADRNSVQVTGNGSVWGTNSSVLYVGASGAGNSLTIADGGQVFNTSGTSSVTMPALATTPSLVTGSGSLWSNSGNLIIGNLGSFNQLTITNGGRVINANGYIGNSATANSNLVLVTGSGSLWLNTGDLYVGTQGVSNQLVIADGGTVQVLGTFNLGTNALLYNSGSLILSAVQNRGVFTMTGGTVTVTAMTNYGTFVQTAGIFDPLLFDNIGTFQLSGGTNVSVLFLNEAGASVTQSGGQQDVNVATNFGTWTITGGVANLTNIVNDNGATLTVLQRRAQRVGDRGQYRIVQPVHHYRRRHGAGRHWPCRHGRLIDEQQRAGHRARVRFGATAACCSLATPALATA